MKKLSTIFICIILFVSFSACGITVIEEVDTSKTQLYIGNYDGGVGSLWLNSIKTRFEEEYNNTSFETGKMGIQVIIRKNKSSFFGAGMLDQIGFLSEEIFFTEGVNYYDFVSTKSIVDITDVVTGSLSEFGESNTIEDKLYDQLKEYLKTSDNKYYAIPHYEVYGGLIYDVDIFELNLLYFSQTGGFITALTDTKSNGPDGLAGTLDDGLPATYSDFYTLCNRMLLLDITPLVWSGQYASVQTSYVYNALFADYEGRDNFLLNYNFNGTADNIVQSFDTNGKPVTAQATITPSTGYLLRKQAGKFYALDFMQNIIDGGYLTNKSYNLTYSHTDAQEDFIKSSLEGRPIAMIADGTWWENEATVAGKFSKLTGDAAKENRRFAFMPLPKADELKIGDSILVDKNYSFAFINANTASAKLPLAKKFLSFCYTDQSLVNFTKDTGLRKGLSYEMGQDDLDDLTYYQRHLWNMRKSDKVEVVMPVSAEPMFLYNQRAFKYQADWVSTVNGNTYNIVYSAIKNSDITSRQFFEGMALTATQWQALYGNYFE